MPSLWHVLGLIGDRCPTTPEGDVTVKKVEATCSFTCKKNCTCTHCMHLHFPLPEKFLYETLTLVCHCIESWYIPIVVCSLRHVLCSLGLATRHTPCMRCMHMHRLIMQCSSLQYKQHYTLESTRDIILWIIHVTWTNAVQLSQYSVHNVRKKPNV